MILLIDNYDSFTYNLYQYLGQIRNDVRVIRNDKIDVNGVRELQPSAIMISPGPGRPEDAGVSAGLIREFGGSIPIVGVCLGHQTIGEVYGGTIVNAPTIMHGKISTVEHDGMGIFAGVPSPITATRYHSLVISPENFPHDQLEITARTEDGVIMGVRHKTLRHLEGVQFHPESVLTEYGMKMIDNFIKMIESDS